MTATDFLENHKELTSLFMASMAGKHWQQPEVFILSVLSEKMRRIGIQ